MIRDEDEELFISFYVYKFKRSHLPLFRSYVPCSITLLSDTPIQENYVPSMSYFPYFESYVPCWELTFIQELLHGNGQQCR